MYILGAESGKLYTLNGEPYEKTKTKTGARRPNGRNRKPDHDGGHEALDLARIPNI